MYLRASFYNHNVFPVFGAGSDFFGLFVMQWWHYLLLCIIQLLVSEVIMALMELMKTCVCERTCAFVCVCLCVMWMM